MQVGNDPLLEIASHLKKIEDTLDKQRDDEEKGESSTDRSDGKGE